MPHRFFIPLSALRDNRVLFPEPQSHQICSVLRLRAGEAVIVLDNSGSEYVVTLDGVAPHRVTGNITEMRAAHGEPHTPIILYQGLLKSDKFEWVLQKGTEIGITEFVPMVTARAIADNVSAARRSRWERILVEAAEQAGRGKIPVLWAHEHFWDALTRAASRGGMALIAYEGERARELATVLVSDGSSPIHLFIGPEGGFDSEEVAQAEQKGAVSIMLGPRILRAETAGLVAASAILYARGDLNAA